MAGLTFNNVWKVYEGDITAVQDFNLEISNKEFIVIVGPSGCGKSTVLRMVAGLEEITKGEIYLDDILMNELSPKDRDIAMVFQNYALYPHMTVRQNLAYALKIRKLSKEEIENKIAEAAKTLGLENYLERKPKALSGGQKQRVALGRAIVRKPKIFLMDEPLSNLDAKLRIQTRTEIINLHHKLEATFIYVTHDQTEAMTMGDRIVVMNDGNIQQVDSPYNVYYNPVNLFVAGFIGSPPMNLIPGKLEVTAEGYQLSVLGSKVELGAGLGNRVKDKGIMDKELVVGIRPENIRLAGEEERKALGGTVQVVEMLGSEKLIYLDIGGEPLSLVVKSDCDVRRKDRITVYLDEDKLQLFDKSSEINLLID